MLLSPENVIEYLKTLIDGDLPGLEEAGLTLFLLGKIKMLLLPVQLNSPLLNYCLCQSVCSSQLINFILLP